MQHKKTISLTEFKTVVGEIAKETRTEFPNRFFDYAGMIPNDEKNSRYDCSPTNTRVFAWTGGDGVHYSILEISKEIQPVVMTVPMNFGSSMKSYNWVIAENLNEFLSLGYYNGWFPLEQLCYDNDWVIKFYASENKEADYQSGGDIHFVKKLRNKIGYDHIPLNNQRLKDLENKYFGQLQFKPEFVEMISKRKN